VTKGSNVSVAKCEVRYQGTSMSLLDRFRGDDAVPTTRYHCQECGTDFETERASRSDAECPECGASGVRSIVRL
jgi:putative FmdB family regulatory protein